MLQTKRVRCEDGDGGCWIAPPGQDVEDDGGRADVLGKRLLAGGLDGIGPSDSTAVRIDTICRSPSLATFNLRLTRSIAGGSSQPWNGAPFRKAPGLRASTGT